MKHLMIAFTLLSGTLLAQSAPAPVAPAAASPALAPTYSQMYCSGFLTRDSIPRTNFVVGSKESPHQDRVGSRAQLFLGGPALVEGQRYSLLRQVKDPNREDSSPEQRKKLALTGALYQELGWVTVLSVQKDVSVASFDFACDTVGPGDIVVPYQEKPSISFRATDQPIKPFRNVSNVPKGHILGTKDFVGLLGNGQIVYTDFGTRKGIRPGDYLLVIRGYAPGDLNRIDRASERLPRGSEANAVNPVKVKSETDSHLPQHVLGEVMILNATSDSSTALITRSFAEMELGDVLQSEEE